MDTATVVNAGWTKHRLSRRESLSKIKLLGSAVGIPGSGKINNNQQEWQWLLFQCSFWFIPLVRWIWGWFCCSGVKNPQLASSGKCCEFWCLNGLNQPEIEWVVTLWSFLLRGHLLFHICHCAHLFSVHVCACWKDNPHCKNFDMKISEIQWAVLETLFVESGCWFCCGENVEHCC